MNEVVRALARRLDAVVSGDGVHTTHAPGVLIYRASAPRPRAPVVYRASLLIVAQGQKVGTLGDARFVYDAANVLALTVPLPLEAEITRASPETPYLAMKLPLEVGDVRRVLRALPPVDVPNDPLAVRASPLTPELADAALRLAEVLADPADAAVLGPGRVREVLYRALQGGQGAALRALVARGGAWKTIKRVVEQLDARYAEPWDVARMARDAHLSARVFHREFKASTTYTPLQYLKRVRLHRARDLLLEGATASEAAYHVGYQSPSQFSREFKRLFGDPPRTHLAATRARRGVAQS